MTVTRTTGHVPVTSVFVAKWKHHPFVERVTTPGATARYAPVAPASDTVSSRSTRSSGLEGRRYSGTGAVEPAGA